MIFVDQISYHLSDFCTDESTQVWHFLRVNNKLVLPSMSKAMQLMVQIVSLCETNVVVCFCKNFPFSLCVVGCCHFSDFCTDQSPQIWHFSKQLYVDGTTSFTTRSWCGGAFCEKCLCKKMLFPYYVTGHLELDSKLIACKANSGDILMHLAQMNHVITLTR